MSYEPHITIGLREAREIVKENNSGKVMKQLRELVKFYRGI